VELQVEMMMFTRYSRHLKLNSLSYRIRNASSSKNEESLQEKLYKNMKTKVSLPSPPAYASIEEERRAKIDILVAAFRLFGKYGFDEGVAGHISLRDPQHTNTFWVNAFGIGFNDITSKEIVRVDEDGNVVEGDYAINPAAFAIHSHLHRARPDVEAVAHTHSRYGRAWSAMGRLLDPINQDVLAFYQDLALYSDYGGVAVEMSEGQRIAEALGSKKAAILRNHGLLTVGKTVDEAAWWFIALERSCEVQLLVEAASQGKREQIQLIPEASCKQAAAILGSSFAGWFQFQPLLRHISKSIQKQ
jgi:ribulose-5-phosphate 4-epimerase/fuculose-1-phosphate aldolase